MPPGGSSRLGQSWAALRWKLRAERRAGELLAATTGGKGWRGDESHGATRLADLGLTKHQSSRWQRIASLPGAEFDAYIAETCDVGREQKRQVIADALREAPERSDRQHAEALGTDHKTVASVRRELEATAELPQLPKTTGKDGKSRPAKRATTTFAKNRRETERAVKAIEAAGDGSQGAILRYREVPLSHAGAGRVDQDRPAPA